MHTAITELISPIKAEKTYLIHALQMVQRQEGFVSNEAIKIVANHFNISTAEVDGVVSFYTQFKRHKPGRFHICVCDGTACHIKGSNQLLDWLREDLNIDNGETTKDGRFSLETVACLGCCSLAPVLSINGEVCGKLDRKSTTKLIDTYRKG